MIIQIVADSPVSDLKQVERLLPIIALDGAIHNLLALGMIPEFLIGDMDATDEATLTKAQDLGTEVIHEAEQNSTDLEKGIRLAIKLGAVEIRIFQALGGRADHTLHNLGLLKKFHKEKLSLSIINHDEIITYHKDTNVTLSGKPGLAVAIMGFSKAHITSKGLRYDMDNLTLRIGGKQSSSNELAASKAQVQIAGAAILIKDRGISID